MKTITELKRKHLGTWFHTSHTRSSRILRYRHPFMLTQDIVNYPDYIRGSAPIYRYRIWGVYESVEGVPIKQVTSLTNRDLALETFNNRHDQAPLVQLYYTYMPR